MDKLQLPLLSMADACALLARLTGRKIIENTNFSAYAVPESFYGRYILSSMDSDCLKDVVSQIKANTACGMPALVTFTKEAMPEDADSIMQNSGFSQMLCQSGMVLELPSCPEYELCGSVRLINPDEIQQWIDAMQEGFGPKPREDDTFKTFFTGENTHMYGFFEDGRIVSTGILIENGDLSGIHEIATIPAYTKRGFCHCVLKAMLAKLKASGVKYVSLQASDMGRPVYESLGFEAVSLMPTYVLSASK